MAQGNWTNHGIFALLNNNAESQIMFSFRSIDSNNILGEFLEASTTPKRQFCYMNL